MNLLHVSNLTQALEWLTQGKDICLRESEFISCDKKNKIVAFFYRKSERKEVQKIINFIQANFKTAVESNNEEWFKLSNAIIKKYVNNRNVEKIIAVFEREVVKQRNEVAFSHPKNQAAFEKWKNYEMPEVLYKNHSEFCTFLETSNLLSQMKVTRDVSNERQPKEIDGEAALFVNGDWMKWSQLKETFEVIYSSAFRETFIVKKDTRDVYTYLDNGKGFQPHHPYLTENTPISKLNEDEYQKVLKKAHCFIRPEEAHLTEAERNKKNDERTFVIQVVSSYVPDSRSKVSDMLSTHHSYLRLIVGKDNPQLNIKKGEVYEVGYFRQRSKGATPPPLTAAQGRFRSPDLYEYRTNHAKIVTNIPVSKDEARAYYQYTHRYFRDGINLGKVTGFHFVHQNCSSYVRASLQSIGINVPTEITANALLYSIVPNWIRNIGVAYTKAKETVRTGMSSVIAKLPCGIKNGCHRTAAKISQWTLRFFEAVTAFSVGVPVKAALGGILGRGGVAFTRPGEVEDQIRPELANWKTWFDLTNYKFNMPGVLRGWQKEQPSTFISGNSAKLAIVP